LTGAARVGILTYSTKPRGGVVHALSLAEAGADLGRHVDIDQIRLLAMTATETAIRSLNSS